jgi:hypothetical protein
MRRTVSAGLMVVAIAGLFLVRGPAIADEPAGPAGDKPEEVVVTGTAPLSEGDYKKEALKNAMYNAVEKAVGVQVKSDTLVQNMQLIKDRILAHADGYVQKWEVQNEGENTGAYQITIKAWVGKGTLNKDLFLNGIDVEMIYDWIGKPRIMVIVPDIVDGKRANTAFAQSEIETLFKSKGVTVVSSEQVKRIQKRDAALAYDDPRKAAALGQRFGAEILIVGKCDAQFSREVVIEPMKLIFYTSTLQVKAYNTSNAEILVSNTYTEVPGETDTSAMGKADASIRSIQNVVRSNARDLVFQVVKQWVEGVTKPRILQVIVSGVQSADLAKIERYLKGLAGVQNVYRRSFARGTGELEVETSIVQTTLADRLESNKQVPLDLVSDEPLRLSFEKRRR